MASFKREPLQLPNKPVKMLPWGVAGAFFLVPWFFMDFSQAEQIEINVLGNVGWACLIIALSAIL